MSALDPMAAPQEERVLKASENSMEELGTTGLSHYSGYLLEEPNRTLQGRDGVRVYKEMTHHPVIGGALLAVDNLVRRVDWTFEAPEEDEVPEQKQAGQRWVDLCNSCLGDMSMSWADTVSDIFTMVPYGWSYFNTPFKRRQGEQPDTPDAPASSDYDDGLIGWRKFSIRSQDSLLRWELGPHGEILGMWQQPYIGGQSVLIPIDQSALFRPKAPKNSPEGFSLLRSAYGQWHSVRRVEELEQIGIERDLVGLPVAWVPPEILHPDASPPEKAQARAILKLVTNLRRNTFEGVLFPLAYNQEGNKLYDLQLLSVGGSGGKRQIDIDPVVARKNQLIAMAFLSDWIMLGHEAVGSKALGSSKIDLFTACLETLVNSVGDVFNAHVTPRLMRANGVPARLAPQLRPGLPSQIDIDSFATAIAALITSGSVTNDADTEAHIRETIGLPPRMETTPAPNSQPQPLPQAGVNGPPTAAEDAANANAQVQQQGKAGTPNPDNQKGAMAA